LLLHPADALAVEKHLQMHPGVRRIEISPVSGVAIVEYDESLITLEGIQHIVAEYMAGSTVLVTINALMLSRTKLD
jgi:cation transport ATPase